MAICARLVLSVDVNAGALDVAFFVREMIASYPEMHTSLLEQLRGSFYQLHSTRVCTTVLWILAEYSKEENEILEALDTILASLGPLPLAKEGAEGVCSSSLARSAQRFGVHSMASRA